MYVAKNISQCKDAFDLPTIYTWKVGKHSSWTDEYMPAMQFELSRSTSTFAFECHWCQLSSTDVWHVWQSVFYFHSYIPPTKLFAINAVLCFEEMPWWEIWWGITKSYWNCLATLRDKCPCHALSYHMGGMRLRTDFAAESRVVTWSYGDRTVSKETYCVAYDQVEAEAELRGWQGFRSWAQIRSHTETTDHSRKLASALVRRWRRSGHVTRSSAWLIPHIYFK